MFLMHHIVRRRVNRICVDFLLIVLTWGSGSVPSTGAAQMERPVTYLLSALRKTEAAAHGWIKSHKYGTICRRPDFCHCSWLTGDFIIARTQSDCYYRALGEPSVWFDEPARAQPAWMDNGGHKVGEEEVVLTRDFCARCTSAENRLWRPVKCCLNLKDSALFEGKQNRLVFFNILSTCTCYILLMFSFLFSFRIV